MSDPAGPMTAGAYSVRRVSREQSTEDSGVTTLKQQIVVAVRRRGGSEGQPKGSYMTVGSSLTVDPGRRVEIRWTAVCPYGRLAPDRGVAALVGGAQVAIFRTSDGDVYAIGHQDPVNGAHVMSRGIVGSRDGTPTIASPSSRYVYDLSTGDCLDIPGIRVPVYPVRCRDEVVEVGIVTSAHRRDLHPGPGFGADDRAG